MDTSAAWKLIVREAESEALGRAIDTDGPDLLSCWLLDTEIRRACLRVPNLTQQTVSGLLDEIDLCEVPAALFRHAGRLPVAQLRSLDALHLAAAIQLDVDHVVTYDLRMAEAARLLGLHVLAPA
jgi:predicted nucleic acid-binding protein